MRKPVFFTRAAQFERASGSVQGPHPRVTSYFSFDLKAMADSPLTRSPRGVRLAGDFRDNIIIDRYDPLFLGMRAVKRSHLRSENSEDAVTWNVFRTLRQIDPSNWLPVLAGLGLPGQRAPDTTGLAVLVWKSVQPPPSLVLGADEGASEIDVVLEAPTWVWFIEAKYRSDISDGTRSRPTRDQVIRNLDVGSYFAGTRDFFFSLLIDSPSRSPAGVAAVDRYKDLAVARQTLREHRPDGLPNLRAVTVLTWNDLGHVLQAAHQAAKRAVERGYATRAIEWLREKGLTDAAG
jgi:hypothetical protein